MPRRLGQLRCRPCFPALRDSTRSRPPAPCSVVRASLPAPIREGSRRFRQSSPGWPEPPAPRAGFLRASCSLPLRFRARRVFSRPRCASAYLVPTLRRKSSGRPPPQGSDCPKAAPPPQQAPHSTLRLGLFRPRAPALPVVFPPPAFRRSSSSGRRPLYSI